MSNRGTSVLEKEKADDAAEHTVDHDKLIANLRRFNQVLGEIYTMLSARFYDGHQGAKLPVQSMFDLFYALSLVGVGMLAKPEKAVRMQETLIRDLMKITVRHADRYGGGGSPGDSDGERSPPFFAFLNDCYNALSQWADDQGDVLEELGEHNARKGRFYLRQFVDAMSPRNFLFSNPELMKITLEESGDNLVRGIEKLKEDLIVGDGLVKIRQTDLDYFEVGRNVATTKGKVVFRNRLMELIQYAPTTQKVGKRPMLIIPPWINKYYILDLNPEKSMVKWLVDQGHSVFVISWVNPDASFRDTDWGDYLKMGPLEALHVMASITGQRKFNLAGYCIGGTLLAVLLAHMAQKRDSRAASATFFATQVDFAKAGELLVFIDENQLDRLDAEMGEKGYMDGGLMAMNFNLLRASDLFWRYAVENYLMGATPKPVDLLFWNSDSTRLPAAAHTFYLRNLYLENLLSQGKLNIDGVDIDLKKIKLPIYSVAAQADHIAPAVSVFNGLDAMGGSPTFVLTGSGHIAGIVNPPARKRYYYLHDGKRDGDLEGWTESAKRSEGSWWPHWHEWLTEQDGNTVPARAVGSEKYPPLAEAPGTYVRMK